MGTATNGSGIAANASDVEPKDKLATAFMNPIDDNIDDSTFYPTCESSVHIKQDTDDYQHEVEIPEFEDDVLHENDEDTISYIITGDHCYNKPVFDTTIVEPLSPISSSSRSTPDVSTFSSDYGYESQNSPSSSISDMPLLNLDEFPFWDDPLTELFPSLA